MNKSTIPNKCTIPKDTHSILLSDACNVRSNPQNEARDPQPRKRNH